MSAHATRLYFAYGSNLHAPRMRERVPSAQTVARARLPGFALAFAKRGADGSGKCDILPRADAVVWGAVYRIARVEQARLDAAEGSGYREIPVRVETDDGPLAAFTYRGRRGWSTSTPPVTWYRAIVLAGAREHGLPPVYRAEIEAAAGAGGAPATPS